MRLKVGIFALWSLLAVTICDAETRVALIIGNGAYTKAPLRLANPTNDATAMQRALKSAGFETVLKLNATRRDIYRAVDEFGAKIGRDPHAVGLFYYAGHGIQADGANYLIPVDAEIESEADLEANAFDVGRVLQVMKRAQNEMNIVILDACRDNPLPKTRGFDRGLARMNAPSGTFIAYAAAPGQVAHDGTSGSNGVFTGELLKAMAEPNVPLEQMFKRVITGVKADTQGEQQPWSEASIQGDFYFHRTATAAAAGPAPPTAAATATATHIPTPTELDEQYWQEIKSSKDAGDYSSYIKYFPKGLHLAEANLLMRRLTRQAEPQSAPASTPSAAGSPHVPTATNTRPGSLAGNDSAAPPSSRLDELAQQELRDYGVESRPQVHDALEGPTPANIPGGRLITTRDLVALMREKREAFLLLDALGGNQTLPGAMLVSGAAKPGWVGDYIEQQLGEWLRHATNGNHNMTLVLFCQSSYCWMSYNAAIRAIHLGYRNVYWYRGGLEAWTAAGLQTVFPSGN